MGKIAPPKESIGPNVEQIRSQGERIVRGKMPREVRNELMQGVKKGQLGRLKKDGLKPEIFFHPDHLHTAKERQKTEALYKVSLISKVVASDPKMDFDRMVEEQTKKGKNQ